MTIELYDAPAKANQSGHPGSPISNTQGELPNEEPTLDFGDLLGSFDSREEAIDFIKDQLAGQSQEVTDSHSAPFDEYTHVEWLTFTIAAPDQQIQSKSYYLVTDEGY
ncbi:hypothetical protein [Spirosoma jeollabukense]